VLSESTTSTTIASSESIVRTQQEADAEAVAVDENGDRVVVFAG
jgi:transposase